MPHPVSTVGRIVLIACCLALTLSACGRRGRLEAPDQPQASVAPPPTPSRKPARVIQTTSPATPNAAVVDTADDEEDDGEDDLSQRIAPTPSPTPTVQRKSRNYTIPKEPFLLDPLL